MKMSMWKRLLVAVAVVAMAIPAFSAVESVKVGGDATFYGIRRAEMRPVYNTDTEDIFQMSTRVYVQAALTNNVEAMVRLINEKAQGGARNVNLDLAYIKVSDLLTPGLKLTVGRQEIQLGEGLVVGQNALPTYAALPADDLSLVKAFTAARLDYTFSQAPVDVTAFLARRGGADPTGQDWNLYGLNLGYKAGDVAKVEGYYVRLQNMGNTANNDNVTTAGVRATGSVAGFDLKGEFARQFGKWTKYAIAGRQDNEGWALLLGGQYNFPQLEKKAYVKANLNIYSGENVDSSGNPKGDNGGWISYFPANEASRIGALTYLIATAWAPGGGVVDDDISNLRVLNVGGGIRPVEKVGLSLDWFNATLMEKRGGKDDVGNEIDAAVTYNYSEDLTFGLQYGLLLRGDALKKPTNAFSDDPWQLIASMKVAF